MEELFLNYNGMKIRVGVLELVVLRARKGIFYRALHPLTAQRQAVVLDPLVARLDGLPKSFVVQVLKLFQICARPWTQLCAKTYPFVIVEDEVRSIRAVYFKKETIQGMKETNHEKGSGKEGIVRPLKQ